MTVVAVPNVTTVQGAYSFAASQYPVSSYDCNIPKENLVEPAGIAKSGPAFDGSVTTVETENPPN